MASPKKIKFPEAKNDFSPVNQFNLRVFWDYWADANKDFYFLLYDENIVLESLNLDNDHYSDDIIGIIIKGDLFVNNIYNFETDYGIHLIVLGNVIAKNIIVGGQDINISGNLTISEVFLGFYNHGSMFVEGNVNCPTIIIEDYSFVTNGEVDGTVFGNECIHFLNEPNEKSICPSPDLYLESIFDESAFEVYDINFAALARKAELNQPVLSKYIYNEQTDCISIDEILYWIKYSSKHVSKNKIILKKWGTLITIIKHPIQELEIQKYEEIYKFLIVEARVELHFKQRECKKFTCIDKGSRTYRRAKRLLIDKSKNIDLYFQD